MHPVYLLEDNPNHRKDIQAILEDYILFHDDQFYLANTSSVPKNILALIQDKPRQTGLYFLDIEIKGEASGLELADQIKHFDPSGRIVFITSHPSYAPLTLAHYLEPLAYIPKQDSERLRQEIFTCFNLFYQRLYPDHTSSNQSNLYIKSGPKTYQLALADICSIQTTRTPHIIEFSTLTQSIQSYAALKDFEDLEDFFKLSRSILVNLNQIDQVDSRKRQVKLFNGQSLSFARNRRVDLQTSWTSHKETKK
ncbi:MULTISPECIES: LytTR family DNA-binding domain-containing protein [Aerococcus]|uniref:Response regulator transcription factor n=1 Tax=Aerococcus sanguinicola TaxID=119206 RepID=A0A5N1GK60_9LACT|nr:MULTISPECIES: LytTR family DNA-binding domain-containing protein [Aerococcus]KAA9301192.1 response regulator transcription factor [Aerococcus sanguinicola]MDK6369278.1 LytTR family DNA-binding domain-containing protein [Aerococcus sp. UMB9870]MDK6679102.1 LytTR family DNA-binding domain-containing protein [Aerococcus sp. UMB8608]MDK6687009.1 LytTR family DNA-binding domain-containing protein [Aerococcus sp. UMB8623]MDK6941169.1 LytTR family DNA-binding domain-containing protein [Aerococcus 